MVILYGWKLLLRSAIYHIYSSLLITVDTQHTGLLILKDLNYGYYYTSYMAAVVCNRLLKIMSSTKLLTVPGYQGRVQKNKEC